MIKLATGCKVQRQEKTNIWKTGRGIRVLQFHTYQDTVAINTWDIAHFRRPTRKSDDGGFFPPQGFSRRSISGTRATIKSSHSSLRIDLKTINPCVKYNSISSWDTTSPVSSFLPPSLAQFWESSARSKCSVQTRSRKDPEDCRGIIETRGLMRVSTVLRYNHSCTLKMIDVIYRESRQTGHVRSWKVSRWNDHFRLELIWILIGKRGGDSLT